MNNNDKHYKHTFLIVFSEYSTDKVGFTVCEDPH